MRYLDMNLTKYVQDLYWGNFKIQVSENKGLS